MAFDLAPDGRRIVLSELELTRKLALAEDVAGLVAPRRDEGASRR